MTYRAQIIGGFGNNLFQWANAYAQALAMGVTLVTNQCLLDQVFDLPDHEIAENDLVFRGYGQDQDSLIYRRSEVLQWFKWKPEFERQLVNCPSLSTVAHIRAGNYRELGYPVIGREALPKDLSMLFQDESASGPDESLSFLSDFFVMMKARVLFRANSTFSFWAAVLGENEIVWSPRIDGLGAGVHDDVRFEAGNHCKLADLPGFTDLHLAP